MNTQQELILTKEVEGVTLTFSNVSGNTFKVSATGGAFTLGKGANYSNGATINQPAIAGQSILITKAEIERLGTYKLYLNGKDILATLIGKWIDNKGREIIFADASDIYYYFRRPDCGFVQMYRADGSHYATEFHYAIGRTKGRGLDTGKEIEVLAK
jgi:hypothetical protein